MGLLDRHGLVVRVHLQNQLLQVEEGFFVSGTLSHLHHTLPEVLGLHALTLLTDLIDYLELDNAGLLQNGAAHVLLTRELDLDALGMRLCPDEAGVNQAHLVHALDALQAQGEELTRLERRLDPCGRRLQVALALAAELQQALLGQLVGDVDLGLDALHAGV